MKRAILLSAAIALFASCAKDNINDGKSVANNEGIKVVLSADEITSIAYDNPRELSEKEIMGIADDFLCASAEKTGTRSLTNNSYKILSKLKC